MLRLSFSVSIKSIKFSFYFPYIGFVSSPVMDDYFVVLALLWNQLF